MQNAAAWLIFGLRHRDHITDALLELHWLRVPERVQYKLLSMMFRPLHWSGPHYLEVFHRVADLPGCRGIRSADTHHLCVPASRLVSAGGRSFNVAGANLWNALPPEVTNSVSLSEFKMRLKTHLFRRINKRRMMLINS